MTVTDSPQELRRQLVSTLRAKDAITAGTAVEAAFLTVPRDAFVRATADQPLERIYADSFVVTRWRDGGPAVSSSAPSLMARMLRLLNLAPGQRVLEIGTGSGYNAALLAAIVGPSGAVVSVEIDEQAAADADTALKQLGSPVTVICGDGADGAPAHAPFDRMIVTALATTAPRAWHEQLREGGVLVTPLFFGPSAYTQMVVAFDRTPAGFASRAFTSAGFMALRGAAADARTTPAVGVFDHTRGAWTRKLSGDSLRDLEERARLRLLRTLLSDPRHEQVAIHDPHSFTLYATLTAPGLHLAGMFETGAGSAVALIDPTGHSIAALSSPKDPAARGMLDLRQFGTDAAREQVLALMAPWRQWSMHSEVEVEIDYRQRPDGQPVWRSREATSAAVVSRLP